MGAKGINEKAAVLLLPLFFVLIVTPVYASWVDTGDTTGIWTVNGTGDEWKATTDGAGSTGRLWSPALANFSAFQYNITVANFTASLPFLWFTDSESVTFDLTVTSALFYGSFDFKYTLYSAYSWFGAASERRLYVEGGNYSYDMPNQFSLYVVKLNASFCMLKIGFWYNGVFDGAGDPAPIWHETTFNATSINPTFFNNEVVLALQVSYQGCGSFDVYVHGTGYVNGALPTYQSGVDADKVVDIINNNWFTDLLKTLSMVGGFFSAVLGAVVKAFASIVPVLPYVFLVYLLDAAITSIATSSFTPLGAFFGALFGYAYQSGMILVGLAQAVASALPF